MFGQAYFMRHTSRCNERKSNILYEDKFKKIKREMDLKRIVRQTEKLYSNQFTSHRRVRYGFHHMMLLFRVRVCVSINSPCFE